MKRREFLEKSVAGMGGIVLGSGLASAKDNAETFDPWEKVELGNTGIKVTRVGFGTGFRGSQRSSAQTRMGKEKFDKLLKFSWERGLRFYDTADLYGSHPYVGRVIGEHKREEYTLLSKIWFRKGGIPEKKRPPADVVVDRFLEELKTDYIDVVLLHCVTSGNWPEELSDYMKAMEKLQKKGVIRAKGVSCHTLDALEAAAEEPWVDSVHIRLNPYGAKMDGAPEEHVAVARKLHDAGKGVVAMKVIGAGEFSDSDEKRNTSVAMSLGLDCVDTMIVGFTKPEHITDIETRVRRVPVDTDAEAVLANA